MSAHAPHMTRLEDPGPFNAGGFQKIAFVCIAAGILGLLGALAVGGPERFFSSLLQGMLVPLYLSLGALFYMSVHTVGNAHWMQPLRRLFEGMSSGLPLAAAIAVLLCTVGAWWLYDWAYLSGTADHDGLFHVSYGSKALYMTHTRFIITSFIAIALWIGLRHVMIKASIEQDLNPGCIRDRMMPISIVFLMAFALGFTIFIWDFVLALQVNWFSTMWGVYCLTSMIQVFLCVTILLVLYLKQGPLKHHIGEHIIHDLGTWMVAWSCFCAYIGFSQYMLIYYANLDEETFFYVMRTQHGYGWLFIFDALLRWPLPFLGLMSQSVRTKAWALIPICSLVLVGNWIDWSWLIFPAFSPNAYRNVFFGPEILVAAGCFGGWLYLASQFWKKHGLIAKGEPRVLPAINAEHLH